MLPPAASARPFPFKKPPVPSQEAPQSPSGQAWGRGQGLLLPLLRQPGGQGQLRASELFSDPPSQAPAWVWKVRTVGSHCLAVSSKIQEPPFNILLNVLEMRLKGASTLSAFYCLCVLNVNDISPFTRERIKMNKTGRENIFRMDSAHLFQKGTPAHPPNTSQLTALCP